MRIRRLLPLLAATVLLSSPYDASQNGRVVVLGFDGAHDETAAALMDAGELPHLAELREQGTFGGLRSTAPPESPVAWASINTGTNPAKTNVLGFLLNQVVDGGPAVPTFGHLVQNDRRAPNEFADAPFFADWTAGKASGVAFGLTLVVFLVVFAGLLRMNKGVAFVLSFLLGVAGAYGAYAYHGYLPETIPVWKNPNEGRNFWDFAAEAGKRPVIVDAAMAFDMHHHHDSRVLFGFGTPDARAGLGEWFLYTTDYEEQGRVPDGRSTGTAGTVFRVEEDEDGVIASQIYGPVNFWEAERLAAEYERLGARYEDPDLGFVESQEIQTRRTDIREQLGVDPQRSSSFKGPRLTLDLVVERDASAGIAKVTIAGETQELAEGEWSDYFHLRFDLNPLLKVHAVTRVKVVHLFEPHFELFVNVLDVDPANAPFWQPVSHPTEFSAELSSAIDKPFETYGWPSATMPFKDDEISPETMLEDLEFTMKWREEVAKAAFDGGDFDLYFAVFSVTDRVQHMMYQYYDPLHPLYDPAEANVEVTFFDKQITRGETVPEIYRQMDRIVGDFMGQLEPDDTLILCADHGFQSGRMQVHLNNWLADNGYLALKDGVSRSRNSMPGEYVDWTRTRAYSMGMGYIYLNLKERETGTTSDGIVEESERRALMEEIRAALIADRDPTTGEPFCTDVYIVEDEHDGEYKYREADLLVGFAPGYRVSWKNGFGGISFVEHEDQVIPGVRFRRSKFPNLKLEGDLGDDKYVVVPHGFLEPNESNWSGSHVSVDLDAVKGIFFCNRKVTPPADGFDLRDIAPTALALLGVEVPAVMDRAPLAVGQ